MNPKEYIVSRLKDLKSKPVFQPRRGEKLEDFIVRTILSKKFRKYAVTPEYRQHIINLVNHSVAKKEPIKFTFVFGGYKLWRLEESPEVDWAEFFAFIYYVNWLKPITTIYKPGVCFDFFSDDVILQIMNNVPKKDTDRYIETFRQLINFIKPYLLKNFKLTLNRVADQYNSFAEFKKELDSTIYKAEPEIKNNPLVLTAEQIAMIELNVKLAPEQNKDSKWREKVQIIHDAYAKSSKRRPYYRNPEKIMVINIPVKDSLAVGTTKTSVVKFWVGVGALKQTENDFIEYIFSPKQLTAMKFMQEKIKIVGLDLRNFQTIRILNQDNAQKK